jgi:glycosyltransferase involved in cell wall biosynthesis
MTAPLGLSDMRSGGRRLLAASSFGRHSFRMHASGAIRYMRGAASEGAVVCNTRIMAFAMSGVQRVTGEILSRVTECVAQVAPRQPLSGWRGHLWEQTILPLSVRGRLLWSPSATGPLSLTRQVVSIHDIAALEHPEFFSIEFARLYAGLIPPLARRVQHIITVSQFSKQRIMGRLGIPAEKISVVPNGISASFRLHDAGACAAATQHLGLPSQSYILAQATTDPRKNFARIHEAWSAVANSLPADLWLVAAGNTGRKHVFSQGKRASCGPRMFELGFVAEEYFPALTAGALAFVYPSFYEGFGLPILEAMASGTPVIASNTTAIPEISGGAAILVSPHSAEDLAAAICDVVTSPGLRLQLREAGLRNVQRYSWDRAAQQTLSILSKIASRSAPG